MDDRWAFPTPMRMQRQAGSAPAPRAVKSPPVCPGAAADDVAARETAHAATAESTSEAEAPFDD
ncbi:hypothetical protein [Pseudolabrys sp. FHR47]|uniref:hypothetical protein n=1 Tax=Pseudolabrys sp. FHR47 TaxID=2562284 RepID=UPI0010BED796|nr:hypothetical protein [Pseudolabrys sp. FHR47]